MKLSPEMTAKVMALAVNQPALARPPRKPAPVALPPSCSWLVVLTVPGLVVQSEPNERCHWAVRANRFKAQEHAVGLAFSCANIPTGPAFARCEVTLTRLGGRRLDDDNLAGAFKAVRDRLAKWLGVDDADPRVAWHYSQRSGVKGIEIRVEARS